MHASKGEYVIMKIMLIQDVPKLGQIGDVLQVKNGYGRNYLIPKQFAVLATKGAIKQAEQLRKSAQKRHVRSLNTAQEFAASLSELLLLFKRKVGETGRLYGSVTSGDIAERIESVLGKELDKRKVELSEPIKALGHFEVKINIHSEVNASVKVDVVGESGEIATDFSADTSFKPVVAPSDPQPFADY